MPEGRIGLKEGLSDSPQVKLAIIIAVLELASCSLAEMFKTAAASFLKTELSQQCNNEGVAIATETSYMLYC